MQYRVARSTDWPGIEICIASTGYYRVVDASTLDGITVVAEDEDGKIVGCLWAMVCYRHAYLDYYCLMPGTHGRVAAKLALYMETVLKHGGVQWVRSLIKTDNTAARRLARGAGMLSDNDYTMMYKELDHGKQNADPDEHVPDQAALGAGAAASGHVHETGEGRGRPARGLRPVLPPEWGGPDPD